MWIDIPLTSKFFEEKTSTSYSNKHEVEVIEKILDDIYFECKEKGLHKEVALITFYGAQAKLLNKLVKKYTSCLKLRVGTVDKFQGMEREIVIVSFVRNNNRKNIGFAKDPKRINVALSRAQNLLIIVGCSELFTQAKESYTNVLRTVEDYNGLIDVNKIFI